MSKPQPPKKVKLFLSAIYSDRPAWLALLPKLEAKFGESDYSSKEMGFDYTAYYEEEMGRPLFRQFVSFETLVGPGELAGIKVFTNGLEETSGLDGRRKVNLDPGYLALDHLVLATGKPAPHRIYLAEGIYADLHLIYESGGFKPLPWTYPDYKSESLLGLMNRLREVLKASLKTGVNPDDD